MKSLPSKFFISSDTGSHFRDHNLKRRDRREGKDLLDWGHDLLHLAACGTRKMKSGGGGGELKINLLIHSLKWICWFLIEGKCPRGTSTSKTNSDPPTFYTPPSPNGLVTIYLMFQLLWIEKKGCHWHIL